jgi:hypothetical protein
VATIGKVIGLVKASTARAAKLMGVSVTTLSRIMNVGLGVQASGIAIVRYL